MALESLGALTRFEDARQPVGEPVAPDPARHARYREALARQRALDERV
jgi:hypothetical protein